MDSINSDKNIVITKTEDTKQTDYYDRTKAVNSNDSLINDHDTNEYGGKERIPVIDPEQLNDNDKTVMHNENIEKLKEKESSHEKSPVCSVINVNENSFKRDNSTRNEISSLDESIDELPMESASLSSDALSNIRELHARNHRQSILFDQTYKTPSQQLLYNSSIILPDSVVKRLKTEDYKYTEADMIIERKRVALESKKESAEALALQENTIQTLEKKLTELMELKTTLEGENEQMFKLLTDVEGNMQNIADEAISSQEAQWKTAMAEIVENSKREIQNLQDQLIRQKSSMDEIKEQYDKQNQRATQLQEVLHQKEQEVEQYKQQVNILEERVIATKKEIDEAEEMKRTLIQENDNRVDFYRGLYEEEKKQKQAMKDRLESQINQSGEVQQKAGEYERTIKRAQEELEEQKQLYNVKEREYSILQQENQRLTLAVNNLVDKNDRGNIKLQQVQEEFIAYKNAMMEEMIGKQRQYEKEIESLQNKLQDSLSKQECSTLAEDDNQLKQQVTFQQNQIQSLKIQLQKKEEEMGELLSYVEELMNKTK